MCMNVFWDVLSIIFINIWIVGVHVGVHVAEDVAVAGADDGGLAGPSNLNQCFARNPMSYYFF